MLLKIKAFLVVFFLNGDHVGLFGLALVLQNP